MTTRRMLLQGAASVGAAAILDGRVVRARAAAFAVQKTAAEWRKRLTPAQYAVLRQSGTERPYSSPPLAEHRRGTFGCAGCDRALSSSGTKSGSGTGWPSLWAPLEGAEGHASDRSLGMERTAVHCDRCGGHPSHVFGDGPNPTGLRFCVNGVAMRFTSAVA